MTNKRQHNLRDLGYGFLLGMLISIPSLSYWGYFAPIPYKQVEVSKVKYLPNGNIYLEATFHKAPGCDFSRLGVLGSNFGSWDILDWKDPTGPKGDRISGKQTLAIEIQGEPKYGEYEVRTEHNCNGKPVSGVFHKFSKEDIK